MGHITSVAVLAAQVETFNGDAFAWRIMGFCFAIIAVVFVFLAARLWLGAAIDRVWPRRGR